MAITLSDVTFDAAHTVVKERYEEVGGRRERTVELTGLLVGEPSTPAVDAKLDAILNAASRENYDAILSVRNRRRLWVRREWFERELEPSTLVGSFSLKLKAKNPFEESENIVWEIWNIAQTGATEDIAAGGNYFALPIITLAARLNLVNPAISDGTRTIQYMGTVTTGQTLIVDAEKQRVFLDNEDVTPYTTGELPRIEPSGTRLAYIGDPETPHEALATVEFRNRWW